METDFEENAHSFIVQIRIKIYVLRQSKHTTRAAVLR